MGGGVGKESEYGDKARFEARKRVKREKGRGRPLLTGQRHPPFHHFCHIVATSRHTFSYAPTTHSLTVSTHTPDHAQSGKLTHCQPSPVRQTARDGEAVAGAERDE